jgi:hypothetical protein
VNITELLVVGMPNFSGLESNCRRNHYNLLCLDWHSVLLYMVYASKEITRSMALVEWLLMSWSNGFNDLNSMKAQGHVIRLIQIKNC